MWEWPCCFDVGLDPPLWVLFWRFAFHQMKDLAIFLLKGEREISKQERWNGKQTSCPLADKAGCLPFPLSFSPADLIRSWQPWRFQLSSIIKNASLLLWRGWTTMKLHSYRSVREYVTLHLLGSFRWQVHQYVVQDATIPSSFVFRGRKAKMTSLPVIT